MRKTKVICTIGPASESEDILREMCLAGMNVARLNFSHGTHEEHQVKIDMIKKVREELDLPIAIMLDTKGPEYRIQTFENHKIFLNDGDTFAFTADDCTGTNERVSVSYKHLADEVDIGDIILVDNGLLSFQVKSISDNTFFVMFWSEEKCPIVKVCKAGRILWRSGTKHEKTASGYISEKAVYRCENCDGCPYKKKLHKFEIQQDHIGITQIQAAA